MSASRNLATTDHTAKVTVVADPTSPADEATRRRCDGCGNQVDEWGVTAFEHYLLAQSRELRERGRVVETNGPPSYTDPGYVVWRALMEDLRAEGEVRLQVRTVSLIEIGYEQVLADV
jgi:hypothetical protein